MLNTDISPEQLVVALDIGTTKICVLAGYKNEHGKLEIIGTGKVESNGVSRGVVSNIEKTVKAISDAVAIASKQARTTFTKVHV
ncbi:MAG: cell division protein FtsA, partial [Saprospiraceae bacterium]